MNEININVKGMVCGGCEKRVENALMNMDGVIDVTADHNTGKVVIKTDKEIEMSEIKEKIEDLDFEVEE